MEMPEGWKKFNSSYKLGSGVPVDISYDKQEEAAELLKEMAEALEEHETRAEYEREICSHYKGSRKYLTTIQKVLKKFKEWK